MEVCIHLRSYLYYNFINTNTIKGDTSFTQLFLSFTTCILLVLSVCGAILQILLLNELHNDNEICHFKNDVGIHGLRFVCFLFYAGFVLWLVTVGVYIFQNSYTNSTKSFIVVFIGYVIPANMIFYSVSRILGSYSMTRHFFDSKNNTIKK